MLEEYIAYIPYFLGFVLFGIVTNYIFKSSSYKITTKMVAREIIGAIWVSFLVFAIFDQFFNLNILFVFALCSIAGFFNSRLVNFINKDLFELLVVESKKAVQNLVKNLRRNNDYEWDRDWET